MNKNSNWNRVPSILREFFKIRRSKKRRKKGKKADASRKLVMAVLTVVIIAVVVLFVTVIELLRNGDEAQTSAEQALGEASNTLESIPEVAEVPEQADYLDPALTTQIVTSGALVAEALGMRPETVEMDPSNHSEFANIESCVIGGDGQVKVTVTSPGLPKSDDKYFYLFDTAMYNSGIQEGAEPIAKVYKDAEATFSVSLNKGSADSRLYRKFLVAVKQDDQYTQITHEKYITNPEAVAKYNYSGMQHSSKKGLLVDPQRLGELDDLGVKYATYNIPLARLMTRSSAGSVAYTYGGVTYYFNGAILQQYDYLFTTLNAKGIDVAAIILNDTSPSTFGEISHPDARGGTSTPYRMFNAADDSGVKALAAIGSFLASRYSGSGNGKVSMWIIGNEINAQKEYNHMVCSDVSTYTAAYARAYRVFYNAIKSTNGGAKVYMPLDQQWTKHNPSDFNSKDMLDIFAKSMKDYGDINWGLAEHPYSYPNDNTAFWKSNRYVSHSVSTPIITMDNIEVLTDYMQQASMLNADGNVRSVIFSEMGYSSTSGETMQAAALAYSYAKIAANPVVDAVMYSRQTDAASEIAAFNLALGLNHAGGGHKFAYSVFKTMDTPQKDFSFAYSIVGKQF